MLLLQYKLPWLARYYDCASQHEKKQKKKLPKVPPALISAIRATNQPSIDVYEAALATFNEQVAALEAKKVAKERIGAQVY